MHYNCIEFESIVRVLNRFSITTERYRRWRFSKQTRLLRDARRIDRLKWRVARRLPASRRINNTKVRRRSLAFAARKLADKKWTASSRKSSRLSASRRPWRRPIESEKAAREQETGEKGAAIPCLFLHNSIDTV